MDLPLRAALIAWLAADPDLSVQLNAITEEAPARTSLPWLAIATSASADWSTKTETGYEIRIAWNSTAGATRPMPPPIWSAPSMPASAPCPRSRAAFASRRPAFCAPAPSRPMPPPAPC
jgi:hypothetical protein